MKEVKKDCRCGRNRLMKVIDVWKDQKGKPSRKLECQKCGFVTIEKKNTISEKYLKKVREEGVG